LETCDPQGITDAQGALQMGAWAIFAAPLIMGNDVRNLTASQRSILLNRDVISINQDPLGAPFASRQSSELHIIEATGLCTPALRCIKAQPDMIVRW